jgi:two-component sensor histidine kinase
MSEALPAARPPVETAGRARPLGPGGPGGAAPVWGRLGFRLSSLLAVALMPLGLVGLFQANAWDTAARDQAADALTGETLRAAAPAVGLIREAQGAGLALARAVPSLLGDEAACDALMTAVLDAAPQYSVAAYVPASGRMTCAANGAAFDYADTPLFRQMLAEGFPAKIYVQARGPVSGVSVVLSTSPVRGPDGAPLGYVGLALPHAALTRAAQTPTTGPEARPDPGAGPGADPGADAGTEPAGDAAGVVDFVTFNADGAVLTSSLGFGQEAAVLPAGLDLATLVEGGPDSFEGTTAAGEARVYAVAPVVDGALYALGTTPARATFALGGAVSATPFLLAALMWAGSLLVAWLAAERLVTRYIRRLSRAIGAFAGGSRVVGDLDMARAPAEIREVGHAFLRMTDTILHDEAELEDTVHQKEVLLREVHHRVKNNLQLIASIMNMQMRRTRSPETRALMAGLQERVMSLATVHKELYQTTGLADVRADELLGDIVRQIVAMASGPGRRFQVETAFAPIRLTPDQAVPLSLLLTEGLTNALKYAAAGPGEAAPRLVAALAEPRPGRAELTIRNSNGAAFPKAGPPEGDGSGLGGQLIAAFASQLGATVETGPEGGDYALRMSFDLVPLEGAEERRAMA